jgi:hypothetical protein
MSLPEAPSSVRRRYHVLLAATAMLLLLGVAAFNIYAERATGQILTDTLTEPGSQLGEPSERATKSALLARYQQPQFVIVGPSMAQRWDPERIRNASGKQGFNASIVSMSITDMHSIVQWLADQASSRGTKMPHVIAVIPPEAFTIQSGTPNGINLPGERAPRTGFERLRDSTLRAVKLTQYGTLRQGVTLLRGTPPKQRDAPEMVARPHAAALSDADVKPADLANQQIAPEDRSGTDAASDGQHSPSAQRFRVDGYLTSGAFYGSEVWAEGALDRFVLSQNIQFYDQVRRRGGPGRIEPSAQREFRTLVEAANRAGDTPAIVLPPMSRDLAKQLDTMGRAAFMNTLREWLQTASRDLDFRVYDYDNPSQFTGVETQFYDGSHPKIALASAVVDQLADDDPLLKR